MILSLRWPVPNVPGNVHSADGWDAVLKPVVERYRGKVTRLYFRADAGFANPEVYEFLEAEGIKYAIRLPANRVLQERIGYLLNRRRTLSTRRLHRHQHVEAWHCQNPSKVASSFLTKLASGGCRF